MSRQRDKGTSAETALVVYLREHGYPRAERRAMSGALDKGDIAGVPGVCIEVKAHTTPSYGVWLLEIERERKNAGARIGVLVHKPPMMGPANVGKWRVLMTVDTLLELLRQTVTIPDAGCGLHPWGDAYRADNEQWRCSVCDAPL